VFNLHVFKSKTGVPLLNVFLEFVFLEESRGDKFLSPERNMRCTRSRVNVVNIRVINSNLVESSKSESPNLVFFKTVINSGIIRVRRVSEERLSLNIEKLKFFIIIIHGDSVRNTNDILSLGLERL